MKTKISPQIIAKFNKAKHLHINGQLGLSAPIYKDIISELQIEQHGEDQPVLKLYCKTKISLMQCYILFKEYQLAELQLTDCNKLKNFRISDINKSQMYLYKGYIELALGKFAECLKSFYNCVTLNRDNVLGFKYMAVAYMKMDLVDMASVALYNYIKVCFDVECIVNLSAILINLQKYSVITLLENSINIIENYTNNKEKEKLNNKELLELFSLKFNYAEILLKTNKYAEAKEYIEKTLLVLCAGNREENELFKNIIFSFKIKLAKVYNIQKEFTKADHIIYIIIQNDPREYSNLLFMLSSPLNKKAATLANAILKKLKNNYYCSLILAMHHLELFKANTEITRQLIFCCNYLGKAFEAKSDSFNGLLAMAHCLIFRQQNKEAFKLLAIMETRQSLYLDKNNKFEKKLTSAHLAAIMGDMSAVSLYEECERLACNSVMKTEISLYKINSFRKAKNLDKNIDNAIITVDYINDNYLQDLEEKQKIYIEFVHSTLLLEKIEVTKISKEESILIINKAKCIIENIMKYSPKKEVIFKTVLDSDVVDNSKVMLAYCNKLIQDQENK